MDDQNNPPRQPDWRKLVAERLADPTRYEQILEDLQQAVRKLRHEWNGDAYRKDGVLILAGCYPLAATGSPGCPRGNLKTKKGRWLGGWIRVLPNVPKQKLLSIKDYLKKSVQTVK